ncbi:MAG: hypothetical protein KDA25_12905 [Phycisphaerales bacterium]|nr:hypothetical protein [Phycisphaerales bacterium]
MTTDARSCRAAALVALLACALLGGCTSAKARLIAQADPTYVFPPVASSTVQLRILRPDGASIGEYRIREKQLLLDAEAAFSRRGFTVEPGDDPNAGENAFVVYLTEQEEAYAYDTYESVPVSSTTHGWLDRRWRDDGRRSSSYFEQSHGWTVVPVHVQGVDGLLQLVAVPRTALAAAPPDQPLNELSVWECGMRTQASSLRQFRSSYLDEVLAFWGASAEAAFPMR